MENNTKKGLDGTGLELPVNRHANLKNASSDQSHLQILHDIKSSNTPVNVHTSPPKFYALLWHCFSPSKPFLFLSFHFNFSYVCRQLSATVPHGMFRAELTLFLCG